MRLGRGWENDGYKKIQLTPEVTLYMDRFNAEWDTDIYGWMFVHNTGENNPGTYLVTYNNIRPTQLRYKYNDLTRSKYIKSNGHRFENFKTYKLTSFKDPTISYGLTTPIELCWQANIASLISDFIIRDKKPIYFLSKVEMEDGYVGPYPRYPIDYGPKINFERRLIREIIKKKYYGGKLGGVPFVHITSIKNYSQGNIDDKELLKGFMFSFFLYDEVHDKEAEEYYYVHFEECKDKNGQLFLKITPCKLAENLKNMGPKEFVYEYYSKKYIEEESIKGEGNVSFRDMLKTELFEQLPEEQTKETLIPMEYKRLEDRCVDAPGLQELIEERLGVLEDVESITKPLHNEKYWKQYKPYRCQDGIEINVKIATRKTLSDNLTNALNSFDHGVENSL